MRSRLTYAVAVAAALLAVGCSRKKDPPPRLEESGQEAWVVDEIPYMIQSTHYERGPSNTVLYVMRYPAPAGTDPTALDTDAAGILVWPVVKHAYNNKTYLRARIPPEKGTTAPTVRMAVDVLTPDGKELVLRYEVPPAK